MCSTWDVGLVMIWARPFLPPRSGRRMGRVMSMKPAPFPEPDPLIAEVVRDSWPRPNDRPLAVAVRDHLGEWLKDEDFAKAFGVRGRPGYSPVVLALVTVRQQAENLTDRQAVLHAKSRLDWKYLLGLPLTGGSVFDHTVLPEFRKKVAEAGLERVALDALLERLKEEGLLRAGGKQRTDSTGVIATVAALNRLELAGESMRAALDALAAAAPGWTMSVLDESWMRRYGTPVTSWRPPMTEKKRSELAIAYAEDGYALPGAVYDPASPDWLRNIPAVQVLRTVLLQNYVIVTGEDGTEVVRRREKSVREGGDGLPPGDKRTASPWDLDARWSVKRDEFWLGYKLHITETCDDRPPCDCGATCGKGCQAAAFPNIITDVATTTATVTDNAMTAVIDDHLPARELVPARHYLDSGYLSAQILVGELRRLGIALVGPLLADTSPQD